MPRLLGQKCFQLLLPITKHRNIGEGLVSYVGSTEKIFKLTSINTCKVMSGHKVIFVSSFMS